MQRRGSTAWVWIAALARGVALERASLACLRDRSSRPRRSPRRLSAELEQRVCEARQLTGWGPRLVAGARRRAASDGLEGAAPPRAVARAAARRARPANRYEWPCPGDLLHMDVSRYARFRRPGHAVTGDRSHAAAGGRDPRRL